MKLIDDAYYEFYDGPTGPRGSSPKEKIEQVDAVAFTRYNFPGVLFFHPVNEGNIPVQYRSKLVEQGMLAGISDFVILKPSRGFHGALIEMKRSNKSDSKVSPDQIEILKQARSEGYFTAITYGFDEFRKALLYYLD
ncbi:putative nuclease containing VRR-NUC domain [Pantoea phage vB_PagM_PSKM]|uniref:Putative nuclease containing VRR-NUC domain n=1 Tax=Pantoea phage vB_PagM_PSKM TaxID=2588094 RepID=A0A513ZYN7_9CAUD|nr:putative nuclease containing VRR-NUC domain [Pantoea phage vB_PagM_PSKM]QDH45791.1 putative nuclease containing VRR-NUC domain [Pantoea phage vB_PagM_PSKM]